MNTVYLNMMFLLAMVSLLPRNMDLVDPLRATIKAKHEAAELDRHDKTQTALQEDDSSLIIISPAPRPGNALFRRPIFIVPSQFLSLNQYSDLLM